MRAGIREGLRLLTVIVLLWILGVAFLSNAWVIGLVLLAFGLILLGFSLWQTVRGEWGAVAAWAACSLAPLGFLGLVALANIHLHEYFGGVAGCDPLATSCDPQPAQAMAHTVSIAAFTVAAILTLRLISLSKRHVDVAESAGT